MTSVIKDIKDKELHDKEQKIYRNLFYFYILKELSPKIFFHKFVTKGNPFEDHTK